MTWVIIIMAIAIPCLMCYLYKSYASGSFSAYCGGSGKTQTIVLQQAAPAPVEKSPVAPRMAQPVALAVESRPAVATGGRVVATGGRVVAKEKISETHGL
jgi:hypothetical protein